MASSTLEAFSETPSVGQLGSFTESNGVTQDGEIRNHIISEL